MFEGNFKEKENWSQAPDWRLPPRETLRLTVGRKLTSTSLKISTCTNVTLIFHFDFDFELDHTVHGGYG
jgi:hypothetical protein